MDIRVNNKKNKPNIPHIISYKEVAADKPDVVCFLFSSFFHSVFELSDVPNQFDIDDIQDCNSTLDLTFYHITLLEICTQGSSFQGIKALMLPKGLETIIYHLFFFKPLLQQFINLHTYYVHIIMNACLDMR